MSKIDDVYWQCPECGGALKNNHICPIYRSSSIREALEPRRNRIRNMGQRSQHYYDQKAKERAERNEN